MMPLGVGFADATPAISAELAPFLDLPLINRDAGHGPGGVNPALPYDKAQLENLLERADSEGVDPPRYAALLLQYRLVDVTEAAGIDLMTWDPRAGVEANRQNLIDSYSYYVGLQLSHRELQWAGMGGLVGADFGGGLIDFELMSGIYDFPGMAQAANAIVEQTLQVLGPEAVALLPKGLQALARSGATITPEDLQQTLGEILVMQKNIFSDLMPMHHAYVTEGLPALEQMHRAGLFDDTVLNAWSDVASGDHDRIAAGNRVLLQREQGEVIRSQWDDVRNYKGDVGEAITYASTIAASPSVAGVVAPRSYKPVAISATLADGRVATLTTPLPSWNWSVFDQRWDYISAELLPKYKAIMANNWPQLESELREPYDQKLEGARPLRNIPQILQSALEGTTVTFA
ncbi:hypothetical protein [Rhodococcus sp. H29-C3]|uniref:hypothetical protein n=1 Tax=Rhodococcus sp. H29-C3 TaxID=3046307 RepID=UPI0024BB84F6|nr:hypothetical protein [Rhodococcus sp. H29-C3]MDJ0359944.1 hypothetical protein [Rhodococcus sp. H29-C3]